MSVWAVIVAGGSGERFGRPGGKQLARAADRPLVAWTLDGFEATASVDGVVVVCHPERVDEFKVACGAQGARSKVVSVVAGGATRQESVRAGVAAVPEDAEVIIVHDGARPLVTAEIIGGSVSALLADPDLAGVVVGHPVYDTLKTVGPDAEVLGTADRSTMWVAQTPQVFVADVLRVAIESAAASGVVATDDASLVELAGGRIRMLEGPRTNIKVTVPEDIAVVDALLQARVRDQKGR